MNTFGMCRSIGTWACLGSMVFSFACGGDDDGKKVVPQVGADGGPGTFSLRGEWATSDFECRNAKRRELVAIDVFDTALTATKVDGDDCVPAGYVAFEGKLPKAILAEAELPATFSFKLYDGAAGDPPSIAVVESGTGKILTPDTFVLTLKAAQLRFTRVAADPRDEDERPTAAAGRRASAGAGGKGGFQPDEPGEEGGSAGRAGSGGKGGSSGSRSTSTRTAGRGGSGGAGSPARDAAGSGGDGDGDGNGEDEAGAGGEGGDGAAGSGAAGSGTSSSLRNCKGPILPGAQCDHVAQCGCKAGENCRFDGAEPPSCFPAGEAKVGEPCDEDAECAVGVCVEGLCAQMCRTDNDCNGRCVGVTIDGEDVEGYLACLKKCDPVLQPVCYSTRPNTPVCNPCGAGATCLPTAQFAGCFLGAFTTLRDPGDPCTADEECYGGGCLDGTCREWCRYDLDCPDSSAMCQTGLGFFASSGDEIGMCTPGFSQDDG